MKTNCNSDIPCPHCNKHILVIDENQPTKITKTQLSKFYICKLCETKVKIIIKR